MRIKERRGREAGQSTTHAQRQPNRVINHTKDDPLPKYAKTAAASTVTQNKRGSGIVDNNNDTSGDSSALDRDALLLRKRLEREARERRREDDLIKRARMYK